MRRAQGGAALPITQPSVTVNWKDWTPPEGNSSSERGLNMNPNAGGIGGDKGRDRSVFGEEISEERWEDNATRQVGQVS